MGLGLGVQGQGQGQVELGLGDQGVLGRLPDHCSKFYTSATAPQLPPLEIFYI